MNKQYQNGFSVIEVGIIVAAVAVIGLLGWKFYDAKVNKDAVSNVTETKSTADMVPGDLADLVDLSEIRQNAIADKNGVTVVHVELEQSGDKLVYKAELSDGTVTVYNARTGARISSKALAEKTSEVLPADVTTGISFAKALEVAKAEKPGSKVYKIELELEGGVVVYSVRFTDQARVDVNAQSGAVVRTKAAKVEASSSKAPAATTQNATSNSGSGSVSSGSSTSSGSSHSGSSVSDDSGHDLSDNDDDDADDSDDDDISGDHHGGSSKSDDNSGSGSRR
jgi:uncharacterized membrane protein YkoI